MLLIPLSIFGFCILLYVVAVWEPHRIRSYEESLPDDSVLPPYLKRFADELEHNGFECDYWRHSNFDMACMLAFSPDRIILAHVGEGKLAGRHAKQIWLCSRLHDDRVLVTTDTFDEGDPSKVLITNRVIHGTPAEMLAAHREYMAAQLQMPIKFAEPSPRAAFEWILRKRAERLVEWGRARWMDPDRKRWRFTLKGGFFVVAAFLSQLLYAIPRAAKVLYKKQGS